MKVYQVLLIYQYLSLSGYHVLLQQSQEAYQVLEFLEMFLTHDPTQPNPTRGSTHPWTILTQRIQYTTHQFVARTVRNLPAVGHNCDTFTDCFILIYNVT